MSSKVFDEKMLGVNPFIKDLVIEVGIMEVPRAYGFHNGNMLTPIHKEVERGRITKLYATKDKRMVVINLTPNACKILFWFMFAIKPGYDYLFFNRKLFAREANISNPSVVKGVQELIRHQLLAETNVVSYYWINPEYFFKGDRPKKYPKKVHKIILNPKE